MPQKSSLTLFIEKQIQKNNNISTKELVRRARLARYRDIKPFHVYNVRAAMKKNQQPTEIIPSTEEATPLNIVDDMKQYIEKPRKNLGRPKGSKNRLKSNMNTTSDVDFAKIAINIGLVRSRQLLSEIEQKFS